MASGSMEATRPTNPSVFGTAADVRRAVGELTERMCNSVDRLCGAEPPAPVDSKEAPRNMAVGLLAEAEADMLTIRALVDRMNRELDRLDNKLP